MINNSDSVILFCVLTILICFTYITKKPDNEFNNTFIN